MRKVIDIETGCRKNKTFLKKGYAASPFRVADITEDKRGPLLQLMIMSSSPGILDGDHYAGNVRLAAGSTLELKTQSYQRLFNMKQGASQHMNIFLETNASLTYLPYPSVPHASSIFFSMNKIYLAEANCQLTWGEVVTCGRNLNGEQFLFTSFQNLTEIYLSDQLVIRDNLVMRPHRTELSGIGMLEGYTHQAMLLFVNNTVDLRFLSEKVHQWLAEQCDIRFGITALPVNGLVVRLLGFKAEQLYACLQHIASGFLSKHKEVRSVSASFINAETNGS